VLIDVHGFSKGQISADSAKERGKWITDPVSVKASKKLHVKARKHASSTVHQIATVHMKNGNDVAAQITAQAQAQSNDNKENILRLHRLAYFLFSQEIPHTTNWHALVSYATYRLSDCTMHIKPLSKMLQEMHTTEVLWKHLVKQLCRV